MTYEFYDTYIPDRMMGGLTRYIEDGILPGHFLTAVLKNDLMGAFERADSENMKNIRAYVGYLYNETPIGCYGSKDAVDNWISLGGLNGIRAKREAEEADNA